jgi:hypothetical protein
VGELDLCILVWVVLMKGGGDAEVIEEWKRLALTKPDVELRIKYRDLALIFAELTPTLVNWQQALEGWQVRESQYILGWLRDGEAKGKLLKSRAVILKAIQLRLADPVPEDIRLAVEGTNDLTILEQWFDATQLATDIADVRARMRQPS